MNPWSNIEVPPDDPEISLINEFETTLGKIPDDIQQIRKLISGFEVCHFKYDRHISYIKESIINLRPNIFLEDIGKNHLRHGAPAWEKDKSGRSLSGQIYVLALKEWLEDKEQEEDQMKIEELVQEDDFTRYQELPQTISTWLGERNSEKIRLVRLLIARLKWDWKSYESLLKDNNNKKLEFQVCRMDICHYNFPNIIDSVLVGIGQLKPVDSFEGCGSFNSNIKSSINNEFNLISDTIKSTVSQKVTNKDFMLRTWLYLCLGKTIKEQAGLRQSLLVILNRLKTAYT